MGGHRPRIALQGSLAHSTMKRKKIVVLFLFYVVEQDDCFRRISFLAYVCVVCVCDTNALTVCFGEICCRFCFQVTASIDRLFVRW